LEFLVSRIIVLSMVFSDDNEGPDEM